MIKAQLNSQSLIHQEIDALEHITFDTSEANSSHLRAVFTSEHPTCDAACHKTYMVIVVYIILLFLFLLADPKLWSSHCLWKQPHVHFLHEHWKLFKATSASEMKSMLKTEFHRLIPIKYSNIYYMQRLIWLFWLRWSSLKAILSTFCWPCGFFSYNFGIPKLDIIEIQLIYTDVAKQMWNSLIRNMQFSIKSVWTSMKPDDTNYLLQLIICAYTAELQLIDTLDGIFSENLICVTTT